MCERHPHAGTLPNSSRYYMRADIGGKPAGLAVWGYGITPTLTAGKLFEPGAITVKNYLELCRFFVYDSCPKNTASQFLATTHRIIRKHHPSTKLLFTYAAGFQGMVGYMYQASGYEYIGRQLVNSSFLWIPGRGLVHAISLWHRYGRSSVKARDWQKVFPGSKQWLGYNFKYLYWLCDAEEKARLMLAARFQVEEPYPKDKDLEVWTLDAANRREEIPVELARAVPIIKLKSSRVGSIGSDAPTSPGRLGRCDSDLHAP